MSCSPDCGLGQFVASLQPMKEFFMRNFAISTCTPVKTKNETTWQIGLVFCWASVKVFAQCINIFEGKIWVQPGKVALLGMRFGMLQKSFFPKTRLARRTFGRLVPAHPGPDSHHHPNQTWWSRTNQPLTSLKSYTSTLPASGRPLWPEQTCLPHEFLMKKTLWNENSGSWIQGTSHLLFLWESLCRLRWQLHLGNYRWLTALGDDWDGSDGFGWHTPCADLCL